MTLCQTAVAGKIPRGLTSSAHHPLRVELALSPSYLVFFWKV